MATDWKSKFGDGKWVTIRGAHVYVQEGAGLRSALSKLNGSKKKITSPIRKAPKLSDNEKKIIGRNEDTIKKYHDYDKQMGDHSSYEHFKNETKNWDQYSKLKNAAHHAQKENQRLKSQTEPGRYQMVNDYRDPQFTKGDKYGPIGGQHITRRSTPQAIETGDATQELNQIHGMRAPYGNVTYKDKLRGNWEKEIKETLYKAKSARKKAGTEGKLRSPIYSDGKAKITRSSQTGKLTGKLKVNEAGKEKLNRNFEDIKVKRNEDTIKRYNQADPNKDWESFTKLDDAARKARYENQMIKAKREPGRGQTINDYRNPQFTKGDNYSLVGNRHVTSRVNPDASKTGTADQELNQLYAQRRPYGNRTYTDPRIKGSWEESTKEILKNARAARKANGTEEKLRSDVYKSAPQADNEKKTVGNFVANKGASAKAEALKSAGAGKKLITGDLSKDDGKGVYTIVAPKSGKIGGKSDPDGWNVYSNMKKLSSGDFGTTYIKPDGGKVTIKNDSSRSEQVYREDTAPAAIKKTPSLKEALQEKVDAQKQPATPTRAKKSAKADTASNEAFIQRWSKPTEGRKWMEANNQITSLRTQVQQMKASGKSTAALEAKIKKLTHENLLRYGKYGPDDE